MRAASLVALGCGLVSASAVPKRSNTDGSPCKALDARDALPTGREPFPSTPKDPGTYAIPGVDLLVAEPPITTDIPPEDVYGAVDIDLPFGRLFNGKLNFFPYTNDITRKYVYTEDTTAWGSQYDNAAQGACGIPYNAFYISTVAIHPYFLKYAGLDRYCMQDVCISFWSEDGSTDMMLKVTDICTPDSADGVPCTDPMDIKVDRTKAKIMYGLGNNNPPQGDQYPENVWWFFTKCWADGLAQPAYINNSNWFTEPYLANNLDWSQQTAGQQYQNNQANYPANGWETYPNGAYNTTRVAPPINDWDPNNVPQWTPIAGGKSSSTAYQ